MKKSSIKAFMHVSKKHYLCRFKPKILSSVTLCLDIIITFRYLTTHQGWAKYNCLVNKESKEKWFQGLPVCGVAKLGSIVSEGPFLRPIVLKT